MTKRRGIAKSIPVGLLWGNGISIMITLLGSGFLAIALEKELLKWENVGYGIMVTVMIASFAGALVTCNMVKRMRLQISLLAGAVYWTTLLILTALFFGAQYEAVGVTSGLILAGCCCAGMLNLRPEKAAKRGKIKRGSW